LWKGTTTLIRGAVISALFPGVRVPRLPGKPKRSGGQKVTERGRMLTE